MFFKKCRANIYGAQGTQQKIGNAILKANLRGARKKKKILDFLHNRKMT